MNKKKFALTIKYNEFVLFYDEQEYLIKIKVKDLKIT